RVEPRLGDDLRRRLPAAPQGGRAAGVLDLGGVRHGRARDAAPRCGTRARRRARSAQEDARARDVGGVDPDWRSPPIRLALGVSARLRPTAMTAAACGARARSTRAPTTPRAARGTPRRPRP